MSNDVKFFETPCISPICHLTNLSTWILLMAK